MMDDINKIPNPEEFWPDAEKLLDGHFKAKRRRAAWMVAALLLLITTSVVVLWPRSEEQQATVESAAVNTVAEQSSNVSEEVPSSPVSPASSAVSETTVSVNENANRNSTTNNTSPGRSVAEKSVGAEKPNAVLPVSATTPGIHVQPKVSATIQSEAPTTKQPDDVNVPIAITEVATTTPEVVLPTTIEFLSSLPALSFTSDFTHPEISGMVDVKKKSKSKSTLGIMGYAGVNYVDKVVYSPGNTVYMQRLEEEEAATILPYGGVQLSKGAGKFDIRMGIDFSVVGEKVNYSPYKNGTYYNSYLDYDPYTYTVTDTDSAYIFGMLFLNTTTVVYNDSILVTKTDTLDGRHYDATILAANGINRWYLVSLPIEVAYQFKPGRFGIGINAGIAPGMIVRSEGKYLLKDESGISEISRESKGDFMLHLSGGLEFSYLLGDRCRLMLRPQARYFLTPVEEDNGASKNYRTFGVSAGLMYMIR
jgi:hypothetical protein